VNRNPVSVKVALILINLVGGVWLVFAILVAFDIHPSFPIPGMWRWVYAALSAGVFLVLAGMSYFLHRRSRFAFYLAVVSLGVLAFATILDQLGWVDFAIVLANLTALGLLINDRRWYLGAEAG